MFLTVLLLLSAMGLSTIAGYYSVAGMTAIFAASWWPIVIMTGTLEFSKIVVSSWLYRNWHKTPKILKIYFTSAVLILMFITSLGIFGYLSKAHIDQLAGVSDNPLFIKQIDQQIATEQARVDDSHKVITQMDSAVSSMLSQSTTESAQKANKGVSMAKQANLLRDSQKKDRIALNKAIDEANLKIKELNKEKLKLEQEQIKIEAEVGPIKYIAQMMYGDNPDKNLLEKSVRYIIVLIIIVFDPLAVLMFIAANMSIVQLTEEKELLKKQKIKDTAEPPPVPASTSETVHIDKIDIKIPPIHVDKDTVDSVIEEVENIFVSVSNVSVLTNEEPTLEIEPTLHVYEETVIEEVSEVIEPVTEEPVIEKKEEITDLDQISIEELLLLQEPVTEDTLEAETVVEEVIEDEPIVVEEVVEELLEEETIEDDTPTIDLPIDEQLEGISDEELESLINEELEILELIDETETENDLIEQDVIEEQVNQIIEDTPADIEINEEVQQIEPEVELAAESVDDEVKEVIIELEPEVVEEQPTETTYIDGKPITQFLEVQTETEVQPVTQSVTGSNQMLQFTPASAIVKKPDDILSTIKKYHNVRLDDARRTLR